MEVTIGVLADYAVISGDKLNIIGVFQEVNSPGLPYPVSLPHAYLVVQARVSPREHKRAHVMTIALIDPKSERRDIAQATATPATAAEIDPSRDVVLQLALGMGPVVFLMPGMHRFVVEIQDGPRIVIPVYLFPEQTSIGDS